MNNVRSVSSGRRFLVYFVDFFIVSTIASLLMMLVELIFKNTITNYIVYNDAYDLLLEAYLEFLQGTIEMNYFYEALNKVLPSIGLYLGVNQALVIILMAVYFILIPIYNKKHLTLGRLLCKVRVISLKNNDNDMTKGDIILRELLSYVFYQLIPVVGFVSAIVAMVSGDSLVDKCSGTRMIYDVPNIENNDNINNSFNNYNNNNYNDDYINAKVDVINNDVNNDSSNKSNNDDSNDEYKTF